MARELYSNELRDEFNNREQFTTADVRNFYNQYVPDIKDSTVNWKIYHLIKEGVITRVRIGVYQLNQL